jgi:hypothetical protein
MIRYESLLDCYIEECICPVCGDIRCRGVCDECDTHGGHAADCPARHPESAPLLWGSDMGEAPKALRQRE